MNPLTSPATDSSTGTGVGIELKADLQICAPGNVRAWRNSATTALLSWDEPYAACNLCPDAIGYEVSGAGVATQIVARPPLEVIGLKADVEYDLHIRAMASGNIFSRSSQARIGLISGKPASLHVRRLTPASALLRWSAPNSHVPFFDYLVYCGEKLVASVREPEYLVTGIVDPGPSTFQVRSRTNASNLSDAATATDPYPPTGLKVSNTTPSSVTFIWDGAIDDNVSGYEVAVDGKVEIVTSPRYVARNLEGDSFTFSVRARDVYGNFSLATAQRTDNPDREPPTRPLGLQLLSSTYNSVTLGWDASQDNVGVKGYRFFSPDGTQIDTEATRFTVNGLHPGVIYHCAVRAFDAAGNVSDVSSIDVSPSDKQAPSQPTNLRIINDQWSRFEIVWDQPADNVGVRDYTVSLWTLVDELLFKDNTVQPRYTIKGIMDGDAIYVFRVEANDHAGNVSPTAGFQIETPYFAKLRFLGNGVVIAGGKRDVLLRLVDGRGMPIEGADVTWTSSSILSLETASGKTDSSGFMMTTVTAATDIPYYNNRYFVRANLSTGHEASVYFYSPGMSALPLTAYYGERVTLSLLAADEAGNPLAEADVDWRSEAGIELSATRTKTDQQGKTYITTKPKSSEQILLAVKFYATVNGRRYESKYVNYSRPRP